MSARIFKGYLAYAPDGKQWLCRYDENEFIWSINPRHREPFKTRTAVEEAAARTEVPPEDFSVRALFAVPKTPAVLTPVPSGTGGRYAVLCGHDGKAYFVDVLPPSALDVSEAGTRAQAEATLARQGFGDLVRVLPDGAHEAAVKAARANTLERAISVAGGVISRRLGLEHGAKRALLDEIRDIATKEAL